MLDIAIALKNLEVKIAISHLLAHYGQDVDGKRNEPQSMKVRFVLAPIWNV